MELKIKERFNLNKSKSKPTPRVRLYQSRRDTELRKIIFTLILLLSSSCATMQQKLEPNSKPQANLGYLAGEFKTVHREGFARMALEIKDTSNKKSYFIELDRPSDLSAIEIYPIPVGQYKIQFLVAMAATRGISHRYPIQSPALSKTFTVEPKNIHYIGHYEGKITNKTSLATYLVSSRLKESSYAFTFENRPLPKVLEQIKNPNFKNLNIESVFTKEKARQHNEVLPPPIWPDRYPW